MKRSLKLRATLLVVAAVASFWLLAAALTWQFAEHEAAEIFDGHLAQAASMLIAQTRLEIEEPEEMASDLHGPMTHRYAGKVAFQVWAQGKILLIHSQNAPAGRLGVEDEGFSNNQIDGLSWRVFSAWNTDGDLLVQVGERMDARQDMANQLAFGLLLPLLWTLPLLGLLVWWAVAKALQPLTQLGSALAERSPDRLEALNVSGVPTEVEPLVDKINHLLQRVALALTSEKRFTGDAAHELRTPIAALSAQAQVALADIDSKRRDTALRAVLGAADRMANLVEQLLTLSRVDAALNVEWPLTDLADLARQTLADLAPTALKRQVDVVLVAPDQLVMKGESVWLGILLRNLLTNAVRHSPAGAAVEVVLTNERAGANQVHGIRLAVIDHGQGVSAAQLSHLGQRFWRAEGQSESGSGLGLSIVRRIAELHGATLGFTDTAGGGLTVSVIFPAL